MQQKTSKQTAATAASAQTPQTFPGGITADTLLDKRTEAIIGRIARSLLHPGLFPQYEEDDIRQELRLHLLRHVPKFDPARSSRYTYATMVMDRHARNLSKKRRRKLHATGEGISLDVLVPDGSETYCDRLSEDEYRGAVIGRTMTEGARLELAEAVSVFLSELPALDRSICEQLMDGVSLRQAARAIGLDFAIVYRRVIHRIRPAMTAAGLGTSTRGAR